MTDPRKSAPPVSFADLADLANKLAESNHPVSFKMIEEYEVSITPEELAALKQLKPGEVPSRSW